jgi:hypothetical protein
MDITEKQIYKALEKVTLIPKESLHCHGKVISPAQVVLTVKHLEAQNKKQKTHLSEIDLGQLKEPWLDYLEHRKELKVKKYASEKSERKGFENLKELSDGDPDKAQEIVDQSRANSWQGLFPLRDNKKEKDGRFSF